MNNCKTAATIQEKMLEILQQFLPKPAVGYCHQLWMQHQFSFKVTRQRASKLGDYRYHFIKRTHTITINCNLNHYSFLITYLHEVAHLVIFKEFEKSVQPHGKEWKNQFKKLIQPLLTEHIFPSDVLNALQNHIEKPKAASCSDPVLQLALRKYDRIPEGQCTLTQVLTGCRFNFRGKAYVKERINITRAICLDVKSGKRYLIPMMATVEPVKEGKACGQ